jgi:hypothetical protein
MTLVPGFPTDFLCGRWLLRSLHSHHHQLHSHLVSQVVTALIYKKMSGLSDTCQQGVIISEGAKGRRLLASHITTRLA